MPARIAVVEIEIADHRGVDEAGRFRRQPVAVEQHAAGIFAGRLAGRQAPADLRWLAVVRTQAAAERVDQALGGGVAGRLIKVVER